MSINLDSLSPKELDSLITRARKRKTVLKKRKPIATVRARLKAAAAAEGYTIEEIFGAGTGTPTRATKSPRATGRTGAKVAPKYRNPDNPEQTWTGRGKQPRWMAAEVAKGRRPEDFLIA